MQNNKFEKTIKAPAKKVFAKMLGMDNIETYRSWTSEFNPYSTYEGSWKKGSKMLFVGTGEDGRRGGMVSEVAENIPEKFISIRHIGILEGDKEITSGPEVEKWKGSLEEYSFSEKNGQTTVSVQMDATEDFIDYFNKTWPGALNKLKEICEQ